jgi:hypothetical protein
MKQKTEKLKKTNSLNVIPQRKGRIDTQRTNLERINKILKEGKTIYWSESVIYGKQLVSRGRISPIEKTFLIVQEGNGVKSAIMCSFHIHGYGFFLEGENSAATLQIYKASHYRDYFYVVNEVLDKKNQKNKATEQVLNNKELDHYLTDYFEGIKSLFLSEYDDSVEDGIFEFIKYCGL